MTEHSIVIAIDGASASGKSTNARLLAKKLGYTHVDTGAMYRTLAWFCLQTDVDIQDPSAVAGACLIWEATLECQDGSVHLLVNNYYPGLEIRTSQVSQITPTVAAVPMVREWMKSAQRQCVQFGNLVMEGRDIGTHVFPDAQYKFYLDASLIARSKRRAAQGIEEDIAARDQQDTTRIVAPLRAAGDAVVIDNSILTPEQTTAEMIDYIQKNPTTASDSSTVGSTS